MFVASASKFRVKPPSSKIRPSRLVFMVKRQKRETKVIRVNVVVCVGYLGIIGDINKRVAIVGRKLCDNSQGTTRHLY